VAVRVVSMPSTTTFDRQSVAYKSAVLPKGIPRIAVEMGSTDGWWKYGVAAVVGIDRQNQRVICANRPPVAYDLLSINTGSTPQVQNIEGAQALATPVKPIAQFNQRWLALLDKARHWPTHRGRMTVAVVGGGAGGVELLLSMQYRLRNEFKALGRSRPA
jgi:NADH dehydrogenase FAD-containing subunit